MGDHAAFKQAVAKVYSDVCPEPERKAAEDWLTSWRRQPSAWQTAESILHDDGTTSEEKYMAAHTLCTKTQRDFEELTPQQAEGLRDFLVQLLIKYGPGPRTVRIQLCVAIAAMAVHVPSAQFGNGGVIGWLFARLQQDSRPETAVVCMLELLVTLPQVSRREHVARDARRVQEVGNSRVAVRPERRRFAEQELRGMLQQALGTMEGALSHMAQGGPAVTEEVLRAFAQWLQITGGHGISGDVLQKHALVRATYEALRHEGTFETAADALDELIFCTVYMSNDGTPQPRSDLGPLIMELIACVLSLRPRFLVALKRAQNEAAGRGMDDGLAAAEAAAAYDDDDTVKCIVRLFLNASEAFSALIAMGTDQALELLEFLLHVCSHPNLDMFKMSVWTVGKIAVTIRESAPCRPEGQQRICNVYEQFVSILSQRCRFPDDFEQQSWEERSAYKRMRNDIEDVLRDCAAVIGAGRVLTILVQNLEAAAGQVNGHGGWRSIEAAYHCIGAVRDEGLPHGHDLLLKVLNSIPDSPAEAKLQYTACTLVRKYAAWLANSSVENPALLVPLVPRLLQHSITALHDNLSAGGASLAFAALCSLCAPTIAQHCQAELMSTYETAVRIETWRHRDRRGGPPGPPGSAPSSSDAGPLEEEDVCSIIEGTAVVLAHEISQNHAGANEKLTRCMSQLIQPLDALAASCSASGGFPEPRTLQHHAVMDMMHRVAVLFENLAKCPEVVGAAMPQTWAFVVRFVELAATQEPVVEAALKIIIKALAASKGKCCEQWLPAILDFIPRAFHQTHFPVYLYLASHVLRTCGTAESTHRAEVAAKITPMITHACAHLSSLAACNQRPNDTDDLFLMAFKGLLHTPHVFLERAVLGALVEAALRAMLVQQPDAFKSVQSFLWRLFDTRTLEKSPDRAQTQAILQELMRQYGPMLFRLELAAVVGAVQRNRIPDIASTFFQIALATAEPGHHWLGEAVKLLPEECATASDKATLLTAVRQSCQLEPTSHVQMEQSVWAVKEALAELSDTCRRTPRIQAASEKALVPPELWADLQLQ